MQNTRHKRCRFIFYRANFRVALPVHYTIQGFSKESERSVLNFRSFIHENQLHE